VLIAFGIALIVLSLLGARSVNTNLRNEYIIGTPDMTPSGTQRDARSRRQAPTNAEPPTSLPYFAALRGP
jgi:hypothetical protein